MNRKQLTPQEKKILSYLKDTRNSYGESRSRSRFAIAKRKAIGHQALRHEQKIILNKIVDVNEEEVEKIESQVKSVKPKKWRKCPDAPLGEFVSILLDKRKRSGVNKTLKISKILAKAEGKSPKRWSRDRWRLPE